MLLYYLFFILCNIIIAVSAPQGLFLFSGCCFGCWYTVRRAPAGAARVCCLLRVDIKLQLTKRTPESRELLGVHSCISCTYFLSWLLVLYYLFLLLSIAAKSKAPRVVKSRSFVGCETHMKYIFTFSLYHCSCVRVNSPCMLRRIRRIIKVVSSGALSCPLLPV